MKCCRRLSGSSCAVHGDACESRRDVHCIVVEPRKGEESSSCFVEDPGLRCFMDARPLSLIHI
eukprot:8096080-Pyramimonas_sp.AAC.1